MKLNPNRFYDQEYHSRRHRHLLEEDEYFLARAETALEYFDASEHQLRIFDYGCGIGQSIALLPNAEGWDISSEARDACRRRGVQVFDEFEDAPMSSYDIVLCRHVLEHLEQPLEAIEHMAGLLKPGGALILIVPRERHWEPKKQLPDLDQHLYCWNLRTLYNLVWRAGLRPTKGYYRFPFGWHALLPVRRRFGSRFYLLCTRLGEVLKRNGEIVVRATRPEEVPDKTSE